MYYYKGESINDDPYSDSDDDAEIWRCLECNRVLGRLDGNSGYCKQCTKKWEAEQKSLKGKGQQEAAKSLAVTKEAQQQANKPKLKAKKRPSGPPMVCFCVCGHVNSGKSTLLGHLLSELDVIPAKELSKLKHEKDHLKYAFLLDQGTDERERGMTIDLSVHYFQTEKLNLCVMDSPGHENFRDAVYQAFFSSDCVLIMFDLCSQQNSWTFLQKTLPILGHLGTQQVVIALNKVDAQPSFGRPEFENLQAQILQYVQGVPWFADRKRIHLIPLSGLLGDNLVSALPWWQGPHLLDLIGSTFEGQRSEQETCDFVLPVLNSEIQKNKGQLQGKLCSGFASVNQAVKVGLTTTQIKEIWVRGQKVQEAFAGDFVEALVVSPFPAFDLPPGTCVFGGDPLEYSKFVVDVHLLESHVITRGMNVLVYFNGGVREAVVGRLHQNTGKVRVLKAAGQLELCLEVPCALSTEATSSLNRIIIRGDMGILAVGTVRQRENQ